MVRKGTIGGVDLKSNLLVINKMYIASSGPRLSNVVSCTSDTSVPMGGDCTSLIGRFYTAKCAYGAISFHGAIVHRLPQFELDPAGSYEDTLPLLP